MSVSIWIAVLAVGMLALASSMPLFGCLCLRSHLEAEEVIARSDITLGSHSCRICGNEYSIPPVVHNGQYDVSLKDVCEKRSCLRQVVLPALATGQPTAPKWPPNQPISRPIVLQMLEWLKSGRTIPFEFVQRIVLGVTNILAKEENILAIPVGRDDIVTICGDIHGQFYDLLNIWEMNGYPWDSDGRRYIFNGDFVDRGEYSVECILSLFAWKLLYPQSIFLIRGNHEADIQNQIFGFWHEITKKYEQEAVDTQKLFSAAFCHLPLAALLTGDPNKPNVFVVHGGPPLDLEDHVTIQDLQTLIDRNQQPQSNEFVPVKYMFDMMWSDPQRAKGVADSNRGKNAKRWGPNITQKFVLKNNLKLIVRSHQLVNEGYQVMHGGRVITVFSAPNYCNVHRNFGAYLSLNHNLDVTAYMFRAVVSSFLFSVNVFVLTLRAVEGSD